MDAARARIRKQISELDLEREKLSHCSHLNFLEQTMAAEFGTIGTKALDPDSNLQENKKDRKQNKVTHTPLRLSIVI